MILFIYDSDGSKYLILHYVENLIIFNHSTLITHVLHSENIFPVVELELEPFGLLMMKLNCCQPTEVTMLQLNFQYHIHIFCVCKLP